MLVQPMFPSQANGSLIMRNAQTMGAELLGRPFTQPQYFHPWPSAADKGGYDATASGGQTSGRPL